jgi:hypothetical protein
MPFLPMVFLASVVLPMVLSLVLSLVLPMVLALMTMASAAAMLGGGK